jgi:hypothetical protein
MFQHAVTYSNNDSIERKAAFLLRFDYLFPGFEKVFCYKILICVNISTNSIIGNQNFKSSSFNLSAEKPTITQTLMSDSN